MNIQLLWRRLFSSLVFSAVILLTACGTMEVRVEDPATQRDAHAVNVTDSPGEEANVAPRLPQPATLMSDHAEPTPVPTMPLPTFTPPAAHLPRPLYFLTAGSEYPPGIWRLDPGSAGVERVTPPELHITSFDLWLGDGRMAYGTIDGQLFVAIPDQETVLLHDASSQADGAVEIDGVAWSPEGSRLAYSARYREHPAIIRGGSAGDADGLWLASLDGAAAVKLLGNRRIRQEGDALDVNALRLISDPVWSPDGSALMLTGNYWEWSDILWLDPVVPDPEEKNLHDPPGWWTDGSWSDGGRSMLLSGVDRACFGDLLRINRDSGEAERLIEGNGAGLGVITAQELPAGIAFLGFRDCDAEDAQLYLGRHSEGEFQYVPIGAGGTLCGPGRARDIVWDPTGRWAVVSCGRGYRLISLHWTSGTDLTSFLGPLADEEQLEVFWSTNGE